MRKIKSFLVKPKNNLNGILPDLPEEVGKEHLRVGTRPKHQQSKKPKKPKEQSKHSKPWTTVFNLPKTILMSVFSCFAQVNQAKVCPTEHEVLDWIIKSTAKRK